MSNKSLVKFISEARKRGFDDFQIREPLLKQGWPSEKIEEAFASLKPKYKYKNKITVYMDSQVLRKLEQRAKRNMFSLSEQIEDILRRSAVKSKGATKAEKLDDKFIGLFSRKRRK